MKNTKTKLWQMAAITLVIGFVAAACGNETSPTTDDKPALKGTVSISGTAQVGQTLTANTNSLIGTGTISYQWKRGSTNIGTSRTYQVQTADVGSTITVSVTRAGNSGSVTSSPTAVVTFNITALKAKITEAESLKSQTEVNTVAENVSQSAYWVTRAVMTAFENAINKAKNAIDSATTQAELDLAVTAIQSAITTFSAARQRGTKPTVTSVTISPSTANVAKGATQTFTATVTGTNNPAKTVTWSIDQTGKNAGTTINTSGFLTVAAAETLTSLTVRATSKVDTAKSGTATVTVTSGGGSQTFKDITAAQLVADIKIGWNLGNSLDVPVKNSSVAQMETAWGNPVTTMAMITALKNAGFNAIRIPVSWTKAASGAPDYTIRTDWMERVKEIVNYAVDNDMYIILNTHHDENVLTFMNSNAAAGKAAFQKLWEQIAVNFKDYNEKLIFEGLNEPRTPGSSNEWNGGTDEERANLNSYYPIFVNTVRNSGGNNDKRILMINPYAASADASAMSALTLPADRAANKLIVSFHAYQPYGFALNKDPSINSWNKNNSWDTSPIADPIDRYYTKFVSQGIPVIIGEFGAMNKNNEADRARWAEYYISYAQNKGIKCFWWDNGATTGNGELFGLLNRQNNTFTYTTLLNGMMNGAGGAVPMILGLTTSSYVKSVERGFP